MDYHIVEWVLLVPHSWPFVWHMLCNSLHVFPDHLQFQTTNTFGGLYQMIFLPLDDL
jgi:hypothetical protein